VYALDWPRYGESDDAEVTPTTEFYAETLTGFMDAAGLDSGSLVGISMGGAAALTLAVRAPSRVDRLALVDSYGLNDAVPGGIASYFMANTPFANALGRFAFGANRPAARTGLRNVVYDTDALDEEFVDDVRDRIRRPDSGRTSSRTSATSSRRTGSGRVTRTASNQCGSRRSSPTDARTRCSRSSGPKTPLGRFRTGTRRLRGVRPLAATGAADGVQRDARRLSRPDRAG
jgi:pimeloyl-ACP methyl ester carboxylesterase